MSFSDTLSALERRALETQNTIGPGIFRWFAGCAILLEYLVNYRQRSFLFGPDGFYPVSSMTAVWPFDLYRHIEGNIAFEAVFSLSILVAFLWTVGIWTAITTPLTLYSWGAMQARHPGLWDGGDNYLRLALFYLCFANVAGHGAWHARQLRTNIAKILHNAAVYMCIVQLCVVYAVAGLTKVQGKTWPNGTALYYAMYTGEFHFPGLSEALYANSSFLTLVCYATVFFQIGFTFFVFLNPHTRLMAACVGVIFHISIAAVMGLWTFALVLIGADMLVLSDAEYGKLTVAYKSLRSVLFGRARPQL